MCDLHVTMYLFGGACMLKQCDIRNDRYNSIAPICLGCEKCEPHHSYGPAVRMYWLLHYVVSGKGRYSVGGDEYTLSEGDAFLIKPGEITVYTADENEPWHYIWVAFEGDIKKLKELPYVIRDERLRDIMTRIHEYDGYDKNSDLYSVAQIWNVIWCLCGDSLDSSEASYSSVAVNMIKKQYMKDISVQSLADTLGLERSYFSNIFRRDTGKSPGQFILDYRMEKAVELLKCEKYSVSVIAASVGYSDPFSFSRSFKNYFGVPPQKFKHAGGELRKGTLSV